MAGSAPKTLKRLLRPVARRLRAGARRLGRRTFRLTHRPLARLYYRWVFPRRGGPARALARRVRAWERVAREYDSPQSADAWDSQYGRDFWTFMETDPLQAGRYALAAGYIRFFTRPGAEILDVGCGEGLLLEHLRPEDRSRYEGIDISDVAVDAARRRYAGGGATFRRADASTFEPDRPVDVVVFNTVLMYADDPLSRARSYADHLEPGGLLVVVSYLGSDRARAILRCLDDEFTALVRTSCSADGPISTPGPVPYEWACTVFTPVKGEPEELARRFVPAVRGSRAVSERVARTAPGDAALP